MSKMFIYRVGSNEYIGTEAWGDAWKMAKAKAEDLRKPIYRTVIQTSREVYCTAGCFLAEHLAQDKDIKIFGKEC